MLLIFQCVSFTFPSRNIPTLTKWLKKNTSGVMLLSYLMLNAEWSVKCKETGFSFAGRVLTRKMAPCILAFKKVGRVTLVRFPISLLHYSLALLKLGIHNDSSSLLVFQVPNLTLKPKRLSGILRRIFPKKRKRVKAWYGGTIFKLTFVSYVTDFFCVSSPFLDTVS